MRAPVVIALVLAGVVALYLALGGGESDPEGPGAAQPRAAASPNGAASPTRSEPVTAAPSNATTTAPTRVESIPVAAQSGRDEVPADGTWATAIEGTVVDPEGNAVPEALVILRDDNAYGSAGNLAPFLQLAGGLTEEPETWSVTTDANGTFLVTGVEPGDSYTLLVRADGFAPKEVQMVSVAEGETTRERVVLGQGFQVLGYVRDVANAALLADAELILVPLNFAQFPEDSPQFQTNARFEKTDETGRYAFANVAPAMYMLTARAPGFGSVTLNDVMVAQNETRRTIARDFNLEAGARIAGTASSRQGQPLEGVRVSALSGGGQKASRGSALTDVNGRFEIADLVPGTYTVVGNLAGWNEGREPRVETDTMDVRLELAQQGGVEGRVLGPDGSPLSAFAIGLRMVNPHTSVPGRAMRTAKVKGSTDGTFRVPGLVDGTYVVEAKAEGFAPTLSERFEVTLGQFTSGIEIRMNYGGSITGRVVDGATGEPVAGARVTTYDNTRTQAQLEGLLGLLVPRTTTERTARTDEDGVFLLELLSPDVYQIEVEHRDYYALVEKDVRVLASPTPTEVGELRMSPGAIVTGTVYDASGAPLAGGKVTVTGNSESPGLSYEGRTDSNGRFRIENILPGTYQLHAQRPLGSGTGSPFDIVVDIQQSKVTVYLREGREQVQDLSLGS